MKNRYEIRGNVVVIFCKRKGALIEVLIDVDDLPRVSAFRNTWYVNWRKGRVYSIYHTRKVDKVIFNTYLPRLIAVAPADLLVDHIDGHATNNTRANLRLVTNEENCQNHTRARANNTSGYRGVSYVERLGKWKAYYRLNYQYVHVGVFSTPEEARDAIKAARAEVMPFSPDAREAA